MILDVSAKLMLIWHLTQKSLLQIGVENGPKAEYLQYSSENFNTLEVGEGKLSWKA